MESELKNNPKTMKTKLQENVARVCPCDLAEFCGKQNDEEIIEYVKANKECYALLVGRYEEKLTRYVKRISNVTKESIEDILQSVFLKTYVNLNSFDDRNKFSTWIYRITHNETVNYWRKNARGKISVSFDENEFLKNTIADTRDMEKEISKKLDGIRVMEVVGKLQEPQREAIEMRYRGQLSYQEIAKKMGRPIGTIGTLINRGKKILQEELQKIDLSPGITG
jgi:RNA polymerase sigma-70 factor, ECF subfamily